MSVSTYGATTPPRRVLRVGEMAPGRLGRFATIGRAAGGLAALAAVPIATEVRIASPVQPLTDAWQRLPIGARGEALLGISFRSPQVDDLGLDGRSALSRLLKYPFQLIRLGAYWKRLETAPGRFEPSELDWQIDAAERAGKQILLALGAIKTFGYPEFFVPPHRLPRPIREGALVHATDHGWLLQPALEHLARLVERYQNRSAIVGWQIEHESVDPLGLEHSWRLGADFVQREIAAVRAADSHRRPILLNGFLPMSIPVALQQWWRTRDQGDSLAFAAQNADIVGLDVYPRHGLFSVGPLTAYLESSDRPWQRMIRDRIIAGARAAGRRVMVSEGQAEPWETVTRPPDPRTAVMWSCGPDQMIGTYNACMRWTPLWAYLFWGAEYWVLRDQNGDSSYLRSFARVLDGG